MIDEDQLEPEQRTAKDSLERNVSLRAGAGTGKTTTLTARYMRILEEMLSRLEAKDDAVELAGQVPEYILVTTFTERAAADLTESVRDEINAKLSSIDDTEQFRLWRAVADGLDEGYVQTLHSICYRLLQEHAVGAVYDVSVDPETPLAQYGLTYDDLTPGFEIADENEGDQLARDVVAATLREHEDHRAIETLARRFDRDTLAETVLDFLTHAPRAQPYQWLSTIDGYDGADEYAAEMLGVYFEARDVDIDAVTETVVDVASTIAAVEDDTFSELNGNFVNNSIDPVIDLVADTFPGGIIDAEALSPVERQEFAIAFMKRFLTGDGTVSGNAPDTTDLDVEPEAYRRLLGAIDTLADVAEQGPWGEVPNNPYQSEVLVYEYVEAFATVAEMCFEEYAAEKRERGMLDYGDLIALTNHFLSSLSPADRARLGFFPESPPDPLDAHLMVDEFQDTNAAQWEIVKTLRFAEPGTPADTGVFIVGDDKQSIYRFRGADVSVFDDATDQLDAGNRRASTDGDEQPPLTKNFRTLGRPLDAINAVFDRIFVPQSGAEDTDPPEPWYATRDNAPAPFEARSEPLRAARSNPGTVDPAVEYMPVPVDEDVQAALLDGDSEESDHGDHFLLDRPAPPSADLEAQAVTNRIVELLTDGTRVYEELDDDDPEYDTWNDDEGPVERPRPVRPGDVAILLRSRSDLDAYERALRDANVPHSVIKGQGFMDAPEVEALLNLLRVLVDPTDDRALYAVLRSPLFGQTDDDIAQLALTVDGTDAPLWEALCATTAEEWVSVREAIERFRTAASVTAETAGPSVHSWGELMTNVLDETGYLATVAADERGKKAIANVERFRSQLRDAADDTRSLTEVLTRLEQQLNSDSDDAEANVIEFPADETEAAGSVTIMTIHEAKGMEYPVVIVPGADRDFTQAGGARLGAQQAEFETVPATIGDGDRHPVLGMKGPDPDDRYDETTPPSRDVARAQRSSEERAEEKRTLYVACTRARDHLILTGQHTAQGYNDEYPFEMKSPNPTNASSWRDWLQAVLIGPESEDDWPGANPPDPENVLETLASEGRVERQLTYTTEDDERDGTVTIRLPPDTQRYGEQVGEVELHLNEYQAPPDPREFGETVVRISPHQCSGLASGGGRLARSDPTTFTYESVGERDNRSGGDSSGSSDTRKTIPGGLPANVFGTIVHRFCELRPPAEERLSLARQIVADEQSLDSLEADTIDIEVATEAAGELADAALGRVDEIESTMNATQECREYPVTAEFEDPPLAGIDSVELVGEIDLLLVTADRYYVIDYKTDRPGDRDTETFLDEQRSHHEPQVMAYAAALAANDPTRSIDATLIFTDVDEVTQWTTVDDAQDRFFENLGGSLPGRE